MNKFFVIIILLIILSSCKQLSDTDEKLKKNIDSLQSLSSDLKSELEYIKKVNPNIIIAKAESVNCTIYLFQPFGLNVQLRHIRPEFDDKNFLCVPGAYTTINNQIDGLFIENGVEINTLINENLSGGCIISKDSVQIIDRRELSDKLKKHLKLSNKSFFQQTLLIKKGQTVKCNLFGNKLSKRRALIQFEDLSYCIGESHRPITINEFQESLLVVGAVNAINLDMATWSEGWYKNHGGEKIKIGENMINTKRQTNWLAFTKQNP